MVNLRDYFRHKGVKYELHIDYKDADRHYRKRGIIFISTIDRAIEQVPEIKDKLVKLLDIGQVKPCFVWKHKRNDWAAMREIGETEPAFRFDVFAREGPLYDEILKACIQQPKEVPKSATSQEQPSQSLEDKAVSA